MRSNTTSIQPKLLADFKKDLSKKKRVFFLASKSADLGAFFYFNLPCYSFERAIVQSVAFPFGNGWLLLDVKSRRLKGCSRHCNVK